MEQCAHNFSNLGTFEYSFNTANIYTVYTKYQMSYARNHIYPTPPIGQDMTQGQFLSGV